jgi:hypothetical protein
MIIFLITVVLVAGAAFCNAVMDTLQFHFSTSAFHNRNPDFWNPAISWNKAKKIFGWRLDAWHLFKSAMIILLCAAIVVHKPFIPFWIEIIIYGVVWNAIFNFFYKDLA